MLVILFGEWKIKEHLPLMAEILQHLGCIKSCKQWDKLPTSTGEFTGFQPSTVLYQGKNVSLNSPPLRNLNPHNPCGFFPRRSAAWRRRGSMPGAVVLILSLPWRHGELNRGGCGLRWRETCIFLGFYGGGVGFLVHKGCMVDFFEFGPFFTNLRPNTSTISVSARLPGLGFFRENKRIETPEANLTPGALSTCCGWWWVGESGGMGLLGSNETQMCCFLW